ncbi:MAG: prepilin-type N-terminal cleavage/methylation domain-containing protein [Thermodesulfobacteria bacterium]|nr:prepilin-type N-terminal cleavage/methylation domain-containing protein [Thermodesulfobacteriota bacterium]
MDSQKGFTLVEIAVTMLIVSAAIGMAFFAFNKLSTSSSRETMSVETSMDKVVGMELFRLDIEHAGFGIGLDESCPPVKYISALNAADVCDPDLQDSLVLRSTLNNTNSKTLGWLSVDCKAGDPWASHILLDERKNTTVNSLVFLDYQEKISFVAPSSATACPIDAHFIGYPVDTSSANSCKDQICSRIYYTLSSTQTLPKCAAGTKNLLRVVDNGTGSPVLSCVADLQFRFALDTNNDGIVDTVGDGTILPTNNDTLREQLKYITFYALIQDGPYDREYNYSSNVTVDSGVTLTFPTGCTNCSNYHWKVVKKTIKFMDL